VAKIVRFYEIGGPENLKIEEAPVRQPGENEVKLRVQATGLNRAESLYMRGHYFEKPQLPSRIGYEAAGVVEAVGPGVDQNWVGKRVATVPGYSQNRWGVLGEEAIVPLISVGEYPAKLSPAEGASIWMQYLTAWGALVHHGRVSKDDAVVLPAASSSVGLAAIQIVKDAGAVAIAATRSGKKRQELIDLGADYVIATEEEDLPARVMEITGGKGARIIFDPVAGPYVEKLVEAAAVGGTIYLYGGLSMQPTPFPLWAAMPRALSLRAYTLWEFREDPPVLEKALQYVRDRLENGHFAPKIAKAFPLEQAREAYDYLESNAQVGKVVITVS
jgi:NADPH:quinone reductase-like Zn-dependent oxidoreductase